MVTKVAINGFGRIGRNVLRAIVEAGRTDIEVVAINDLGPVETNAHLLRYDSVHGRFPAEVKVEGDTISVGGGKPTFVTRFPASLKPFYMKRSADSREGERGEVAEAMDMLVAGVVRVAAAPALRVLASPACPHAPRRRNAPKRHQSSSRASKFA